MSSLKPKKKFMLEAIRKAKAGAKNGDYAFGAVIAQGSKIIAACGNRSKRNQNPVGHAETLAIIKACEYLKNRHIPDCVLYTTHEPCPMCTSVAVWAKLKGIVYGARIEDIKNYSKNNSNQHYLWRTIEISCREIVNKSTEEVDIVGDFMRKECNDLFHN